MSKWIWYQDIWAVKWSIILSKLLITKGIPAFFKFFMNFLILTIPIVMVVHSIIYASDKAKGLYVMGFVFFWMLYWAIRWTKDENN